MRVLIAVPCMEYQLSEFSECLTNLILYCKEKNTCDIEIKYLKGSLVYDARNQATDYALKAQRFDFVLWLDSDMTFEADLLEKLLADIEGRQAVSGLCFGRRPPFKPCVYKRLDVQQEGKLVRPICDTWYDYPRDQIFEVAACGFACVLMRIDVLEAMGIYGVPFFPIGGLGEDLTFCWRAQKLDIKFHCDSRLKIGHMMQLSVDEGFRDKLFEGQTIPEV